ncbi:BTB/POZ domain-containing protein [Camellia lanceoleosa]|uniref:BTB/POZ domain-containing protein n=1 Tax=Camellia lanceoleosa TaxID=1840588 RepID=A0ACC0FLY8_9ERIC|nr:BTB/POZ domain-containing protein [Camellia lanceoleosa]
MQRLEQLLITGEYSDVDIYIGGHGLVAQPHKIILGLWNVPFLKMFTNGMSESISSKVLLQDVPLEAFKAMLEFMYYGELNKEDTMDIGYLATPASFIGRSIWGYSPSSGMLKNTFEMPVRGMEFYWKKVIQQEFFYYAQDALCPILQVISSVLPCKLIEETCEKKFSMHFDYCTTASIDFVLLDETTFSKILRLERSDLSRKIPTFDFLVKEAICYLEFGLANPQGDHKQDWLCLWGHSDRAKLLHLASKPQDAQRVLAENFVMWDD